MCEPCSDYREHANNNCSFDCRHCPDEEDGWSPMRPLKRQRVIPPAPVKQKAVWFKRPNLEEINGQFIPCLEQLKQSFPATPRAKPQ